VAIEDMELESIDISTAFLNGEIDAEVFMRKPEGIETPGFEGPEWVLQLLKGLWDQTGSTSVVTKATYRSIGDRVPSP
jgi:hypothetical protein